MVEKNIQLTQINISEFTEIIEKCVAKQLEKLGNFSTQHTKSEPEILTREQTKNLLGISFVTLWKHSKDGILKSKKIGSKVFYLKQDVFNLLNAAA
jgi:hypothetical protein